jgi:hypothetical protein
MEMVDRRARWRDLAGPITRDAAEAAARRRRLPARMRES